MANPERIIELVLRFKTNGYQEELDDLMAYGQQIQEDLSGPGTGSEELRAHDGSDLHVEYIPEGSHWRDVTFVDRGGWNQTTFYAHGASYLRTREGSGSFSPPAATLPGGNELSPPQPPQEG